MPKLEKSDSLSWGDALFLYLEREGMPLNIASVGIFDGPIALDECIDFVSSKLPLIPRYFKRVVIPPLNIGLPVWEYDPEFDIRNHIHEVKLNSGTDADVKAAAALIVSTTLDRRHPLWDITLLQGVRGDRTALVVRVHHCLADGIAGVGLLNVLMDPNPIRHVPARNGLSFRCPKSKSPGDTAVDGLMGSISSVLERLLVMQGEVLDLAQKTVANLPQWSLADLDQLLPKIPAPAERLPFNLVCHGPQKIAWSEIPMAQIKAVKEATGTTVNDVVMTVVAAAVRRYTEERGGKVKGKLLRIAVPVNTRGNGNPNDLGNRISFLPVSIPLDVRNPRKLLAVVHERMQSLKNAHAAEFVGLAGTLLGTILPAVQALAGPVVSQLPISLCNIIFTNVPGPQLPLYLLGRKMLRTYPYVPIGGEMGLNCAMLSYNGIAYFGFTGDTQAAPYLHRLEKFLKRAFAELLGSLGMAQSQTKSEPPRHQVVPAKHPVLKEKAVALAATA